MAGQELSRAPSHDLIGNMSVWRFPIVFGGVLLGLSVFYINRRRFVTSPEETKTRQKVGSEQAIVFKQKVLKTIQSKDDPPK